MVTLYLGLQSILSKTIRIWVTLNNIFSVPLSNIVFVGCLLIGTIVFTLIVHHFLLSHICAAYKIIIHYVYDRKR